MTATNHALTGVVIALVVKNPILAIPLAFMTHFAMDAIPHFDGSKKSELFGRMSIAIDIIIAGILSLVLSITFSNTVSSWAILASAFACMSPDLVWGLRYYKHRDFKKMLSDPMSKFTRFHIKIQWSESIPGLIVELIFFMLMLVLAINLGN